MLAYELSGTISVFSIITVTSSAVSNFNSLEYSACGLGESGVGVELPIPPHLSILSSLIRRNNLVPEAGSKNFLLVERIHESSIKAKENLTEKYKNVSDKEQSLKQYFKEFKKGLENADVIVEVVDARDPLGTRCSEVERAVKAAPGIRN
uniref:Uncharacterized protein n=1 Tax=Glossina austeni TaxID=7395 RepID=A0A1A9V1E3_GLOAU